MNPVLKRKLLGACVLLSLVLVLAAHILGWIHSVVFVNELSLAAITLTFGTWWDAAGAKVAAEEEEGDSEAS